MARIEIGGGNTRVGEVYLDALYRDRALSQQAYESSLRANTEANRLRAEQIRADRAAQQAAIAQQHELAMAREGRQFTASENEKQRGFSASESGAARAAREGELAAGHANRLDEIGVENKNLLGRASLADSLAAKRDEANSKLRLIERATELGVDGVDINSTMPEIASAIRDRVKTVKDEATLQGLMSIATENGIALPEMSDQQRIIAESIGATKEAEVKLNTDLKNAQIGAARDATEDRAIQRDRQSQIERSSYMKARFDGTKEAEKVKQNILAASGSSPDSQVKAEKAKQEFLAQLDQMLSAAHPNLHTESVLNTVEEQTGPSNQELAIKAVDPNYMTEVEKQRAMFVHGLMNRAETSAHPILGNTLGMLDPFVDTLLKGQPARRSNFENYGSAAYPGVQKAYGAEADAAMDNYFSMYMPNENRAALRKALLERTR